MEIKTTRVFESLWQNTKRINLLRGGTRSSKSYSLTQLAVLFLVTGQVGENYYKRGSFAIVRSTFPVLRSTVMRDFINLLWLYGFAPYVEHKKSLNEFHYKGREVLFFSLDTPQKLRGRQNTIFWINECNDTPFEAFNQLIMRNESHCYLDYNPEGSPWVKTEIEERRLLDNPEEVNLFVSTYKDNPFLPPLLIAWAVACM